MNRDMIHFSVSVCQREQVCSTNTQQNSLSLWAVSHQLHRTVAVRGHTDSKCTVKKSTDYNTIPKAVMECDRVHLTQVVNVSSAYLRLHLTQVIPFSAMLHFHSSRFWWILYFFIIHDHHYRNYSFYQQSDKKKPPLILMFRKRLNIQANNLFFTFYFWYLRKCNTPYFKTLAWVMLARWL